MNIEKLNNNWQIEENGQTINVDVPYDFIFRHPRKPHTVTGTGEGFFEPGRAVYKKTLNISDGKAHHFIRFDGVMGLAEVYVNGNHVKLHPYGYTPFICEMDKYLHDGDNEICVRVDCTQKPSSRWYAGGGIYRDVELLTCDSDYILPYGLTVSTLSASADHSHIEIKTDIYSETDKTAVLELEVYGEDKTVYTVTKHIWLNKGENSFVHRAVIHGAKLWSPSNPALYNVKAVLKTDTSDDTATSRFGIRTVEVDVERGFILNGEHIIMNGVCVHHDNGIIGAASCRTAEERRFGTLKRDGYNAVRCSHNPPSQIMLDVCDEMGFLVIDEIFDAWRHGKCDYDYHIWFDTYAEEDIRAMVESGRNHPSVVMWSTGNEIIEKNGVSDGYKIAKFIADTIRKYDSTRLMTHALCAFWDNPAFNDRMCKEESFPAEKLDFFAEKTMYLADDLDVSGYNYFLYRVDKDSVRFPKRVFALTESYPLDTFSVKKYMDEHPQLIGEFVWTGWDYFGETGLGNVKYGVEHSYWGLIDYPCHIADCGDYDICGFPKPQWYFRHAAYNPGEINILTTDPNKFGKQYCVSSWGFYDVGRTWSYPGCKGMKTEISAYTSADEAELFINGRSLGMHKPDYNGIIKVEVEYEPGRLEAVSYINGQPVGKDILETAYTAAKIALACKETSSELFYVEAELIDKNGNLTWISDSEVKIEAEGAIVMGTGSGNAYSEHNYCTAECETYHGRLLIALKPTENTVNIKATCGELSAELAVEIAKA